MNVLLQKKPAYSSRCHSAKRIVWRPLWSPWSLRYNHTSDTCPPIKMIPRVCSQKRHILPKDSSWRRPKSDRMSEVVATDLHNAEPPRKSPFCFALCSLWRGQLLRDGRSPTSQATLWIFGLTTEELSFSIEPSRYRQCPSANASSDLLTCPWSIAVHTLELICL